MGKLLRVLVVFILLLGIAALALGVMLFQKRETLKGHVQTLAQQVLALAPFIEAEQDADLTVKENKNMTEILRLPDLLSYKPDPQDPTALTDMERAMRDLLGRTHNQLTRLNDTRDALARRNREYDEATNTIASLEATIVGLEADKKALEENIVGLQKDVAEKKARIEDLTAQIEEFKGTIEDLRDRVAKLNDTVKDREDTIRALEKTIEDLRKRRPGEGDDPTAGKDVPAGDKGKLILVNKEWNFVVIAIPPNTSLSLGLPLTVHRGETFLGKVRVADFNEQYRLAIADILLDWKQGDMEVEDHVFY